MNRKATCQEGPEKKCHGQTRIASGRVAEHTEEEQLYMIHSKLAQSLQGNSTKLKIQILLTLSLSFIAIPMSTANQSEAKFKTKPESQASAAAVFSETQKLTEADFVALAGENTPDWRTIEASWLLKRSEEQQSKDQFKPELFAQYNRDVTNEKPILDFFPVWSPLTTMQAGVRQNFTTGVTASASVSADQRSAVTPNTEFRRVSTNVLRLDLQIDLWKDLFGKLSSARTKSAELAQEQAKLERDIKQRSFVVSLRRIYWSLVVNLEQLRIYQNLIEISQKQLKDAQNRLRAGITDAGEVARLEAQVASRNGALLYYNFQQEQLWKQIKTLLPQLQDKSVSLSPYRIEDTIQEVLACTTLIATRKEIPLDYTLVDDVVTLIRKIETQQLKIAHSYDDPELKLVGGVRATGVASQNQGGGVVAGSYRGAVDDWQDNNRLGYTVGLQLVVPLGRGSTADSQQRFQTAKYGAEIERAEANLYNTHTQLVKVIDYLVKIIESQKVTQAALKKRISAQNKKYRDARITVNELIQDEDALLNTDLSNLSTELEIINIVFDYLSVFTSTPCKFNKTI